MIKLTKINAGKKRKQPIPSTSKADARTVVPEVIFDQGVGRREDLMSKAERKAFMVSRFLPFLGAFQWSLHVMAHAVKALLRLAHDPCSTADDLAEWQLSQDHGHRINI